MTILSPLSHNINNNSNNNTQIHVVAQSHGQNYDIVESNNNYAFAAINPPTLIQVSSIRSTSQSSSSSSSSSSTASPSGYNLITVNNQNQSNEHTNTVAHQLTPMDPRLLYTSNIPHLNEQQMQHQQQQNMFPENEIKIITIQQQQNHHHRLQQQQQQHHQYSSQSNIIPQQSQHINNNAGVLIMNNNTSYLIQIPSNSIQEINPNQVQVAWAGLSNCYTNIKFELIYDPSLYPEAS